MGVGEEEEEEEEGEEEEGGRELKNPSTIIFVSNIIL